MPFPHEIMSLVQRVYENTRGARSGRLYCSFAKAQSELPAQDGLSFIYTYDLDRAAMAIESLGSGGVMESREFADFTYSRYRDFDLDSAMKAALEAIDGQTPDQGGADREDLPWRVRPTQNQDTFDSDLKRLVAPRFSFETFAEAANKPGAKTSVGSSDPERMLLIVTDADDAPGEGRQEYRLELDLGREFISSMESSWSYVSNPADDRKERYAYLGLGRIAPVILERPAPENCLLPLSPMAGRISRVEVETDPESFEYSFEIADTIGIWKTAEQFEELAVGDRVLLSGFWLDEGVMRPENKRWFYPLDVSSLLLADGTSLYDSQFDPGGPDPEGNDDNSEDTYKRDEQGRAVEFESVVCEPIFLGVRPIPNEVKVDVALEDGRHLEDLVLDWWQPTPVVGDPVILNRDWSFHEKERFMDMTRADGGRLVRHIDWESSHL